MKEIDIQIMLMQWIKLQYPNVLANASQVLASAPLKYPKYAAKMKAAGNTSGWPDITIAEPRGGFHGLYIELKSERARVFLRKSGAPDGKHVAKQIAVLEALRERGYKAELCIGFDAAKKVIDDYLSLP